MNERARLRLGSLLIMLPCLIVLMGLTFMSPRFFGVQADEFHSAWPAQRLLRGDVPYVDLFTHRPPLDLANNALAQAVFGETLTASRLLQLLSMVITGYLLFSLFRRWGASDWEAAGGALVPACLCFPFWPLPSAHWQSLPFSLGAILLLESSQREGQPSSLPRVVGAGVLAGLAGLTLQTEGAVVCAWLVLRIRGRSDLRRDLPALLGGIAAPLIACAGLLAAWGVLGAAYDCVVHFPLFSYKGGFNDVSFLSDVVSSFKVTHGDIGLSGTILAGLVLLFPLGALGLALTHVVRDRSRRNVAGLAMLLVIWILFLKGRSGWVHLMFFLPYVLVAGFEFAYREDTPKPARRAVQAWLALSLLAAGGVFASSWGKGVRPSQSLGLDLYYRQSVPKLLSVLPQELREEPVLSLPYGASVYFFREAEAPGIDWLCLPSHNYSLPEHNEGLATWLREKRVPAVILLRSPRGLGFLKEESPLKDELENYQRYATNPNYLILVRKSVLEAKASVPR